MTDVIAFTPDEQARWNALEPGEEMGIVRADERLIPEGFAGLDEDGAHVCLGLHRHVDPTTGQHLGDEEERVTVQPPFPAGARVPVGRARWDVYRGTCCGGTDSPKDCGYSKPLQWAQVAPWEVKRPSKTDISRDHVWFTTVKKLGAEDELA